MKRDDLPPGGGELLDDVTTEEPGPSSDERGARHVGCGA